MRAGVVPHNATVVEAKHRGKRGTKEELGGMLREKATGRTQDTLAVEDTMAEIEAAACTSLAKDVRVTPPGIPIVEHCVAARDTLVVARWDMTTAAVRPASAHMVQGL